MTIKMHKLKYAEVKQKVLLSDKLTEAEAHQELEDFLTNNLPNKIFFPVSTPNRLPMIILSHGDYLKLQNTGVEELTESQSIILEQNYVSANA